MCVCVCVCVCVRVKLYIHTRSTRNIDIVSFKSMYSGCVFCYMNENRFSSPTYEI